MAQHRRRHGQAVKKQRSKVILRKDRTVEFSDGKKVTYPTANVARLAIAKREDPDAVIHVPKREAVP